MERLALLLDEVFGLTISEGTISNILARAREPLLTATAAIEQVVLASPVVCSDETLVRVKGKNWWEWVFVTTIAVPHIIKPSRAKAVVADLLGEIRRDVPYTNNVSERHLRPSVIFRKVTNGFRCEWGAETYAAFRSVVSTAKANGASVLETVQFVLSEPQASKALAGVG